MAVFSGTLGSVVYMTGGTTTIVGIAEWELEVEHEPVEVTAFGDNWKKHISGVRGFSGSFQGNSDSDASQVTLRSAYLGGSVFALRLYESATNYWNVGTAIPDGMGRSISQTGKGETSFNFLGSDTLSYV